MEINDETVGFINSGCAHTVAMSNEEFKQLVGHTGEAPNVVIMSVVLDPAHQGKSYSTLLMAEFVKRMRAIGKRAIHLMCKEKHIDLYRRLGYSYANPSNSIHGGMTWHEMVMII